jgi:pimeloyl-ACP methyl ester carboxylesterase
MVRQPRTAGRQSSGHRVRPPGIWCLERSDNDRLPRAPVGRRRVADRGAWTYPADGGWPQLGRHHRAWTCRAPARTGQQAGLDGAPYHAKGIPTPAFLATFLKIQALRRFSGPEAAAAAFLRFAIGRTDGVRSYDLLPADARAELLRNGKGTMIELDAGTGDELTDDSLRGIKQPVMILKGACSQPIFLKVTDRLAALLPQAQVRVIPAAGHMMQFDQPAEFEAAVLDAAG